METKIGQNTRIYTYIAENETDDRTEKIIIENKIESRK